MFQFVHSRNRCTWTYTQWLIRTGFYHVFFYFLFFCCCCKLSSPSFYSARKRKILLDYSFHLNILHVQYKPCKQKWFSSNSFLFFGFLLTQKRENEIHPEFAALSVNGVFIYLCCMCVYNTEWKWNSKWKIKKTDDNLI